MAHQISTISKERLKEKCGSITSAEIREKIRYSVKLICIYCKILRGYALAYKICQCINPFVISINFLQHAFNYKNIFS